jgi:hypothetical protein
MTEQQRGAAAVLGDVAAGDRLLSLCQAAHLDLLKRDGKGPSVGTLYRWLHSGRRGVTLETALTPRGIATTESAVARFLARMNGLGPETVGAPLTGSRAHKQAVKELDEAGL